MKFPEDINTSIVTHNSNKGASRNGNPTHICIHYIGTPTGTAKSQAEYYRDNNLGLSPHYFVDALEVYQINDDNNASAHCGGGTPPNGCTGNNDNSVGVEMCTSGNYDVNTSTEKNTIELVKYLMLKYNIPVDNVFRHYDSSGKQCPAPFMSPEEVAKSQKNLDSNITFPNGGERWTKFKNSLKNNNPNWQTVVKAFMEYGYQHSWVYNQQSSYNITVLNKAIKDVRADCSGLVSAVLKWYNIINTNYNTEGFINNFSYAGFTKISFTTLDACQPGDILLSKEHTEIYAGNNKSYNWGVDPKNSTPDNQYLSNVSSNWTTVIRGLANIGGSANPNNSNPNAPYTFPVNDEQANLIIQANKQVIQNLKDQGLDAVIEHGYEKIDFSARLNDYAKYLNVHKINGIQPNPNGVKRKNFKQDFIVIVRKKLYYAATMSSEENYLRIYYFNNLTGCSTSHQVNGVGTCSFQVMGGQRVTVINNMQEKNNNWVDYEHLINGLTNIDDSQEAWRTGTEDWNDTTADGVDYRNLMKAKQAKYGWRYAEKCDIEPMDEVIVFSKSRYVKNNQGQYRFNKVFVGYIDTVVKTCNAGASAPSISVSCTDQTKLLNQSYVNYSPSYMPGKFNNGYLDISFDTDKFGYFKINEPIAYGMEDVKDPEVLQVMMNDYIATNIFYGLQPDVIIRQNCLAAGIPERYLKDRIEPVKIVPYLYNQNSSTYDFMNAQFKKRMDYLSEISKICHMEFFFDEEGKAVFKIPSYVIGVNYLTPNNDNNEIDANTRGLIGLKKNNLIDVSVLTPYCKLVTPMIYTVEQGKTLQNVSQDVYGHIDRAVDIQVLNISQCQRYSTTMPMKQCDILVLKFDDNNPEARKEYRKLIAFDLTSVLAQKIYNAQQNPTNNGVMDSLYSNTVENTVTMSALTDELIKVIPLEDLISFTITDSDKDICTTATVTGADFMDFFNGKSNGILSIKRMVPSLSMIMRYGVRPAPVETTPFSKSEDDSELLCDMKLLQQAAMRYTASANVIENSEIKVGTPIRFFSYDEHPQADTMAYANSVDLAKTVFYITRISRTFKQDGVSTMNLELTAGRTMGQQSIYDTMFTLYQTFYNERKDISIDTANMLLAANSPFKNNESTSNESTSTIDDNVTGFTDYDFKLSNPPATSIWDKKLLFQIYNYFHKTKKYNKAVCCGIIANLAMETGGRFDYKAKNSDANNAKTNYGIVQWQGGRADKLVSMATQQNKSWDTLDWQLEYIVWELENYYQPVLNAIKNTSDTEDGAYNFGYTFAEKYEGCDSRFYDTRANIAKSLFGVCFKGVE